MSQSLAERPAPSSAPVVISAYEEIREKITTLAHENASKVFKYEDPKENKLARSHVHGLRKVKGDIERARVAAKAEALTYSRRVDSVAADLEKAVEDMIAVHQKPLDEIEQREKARTDNHRSWLAKIAEARQSNSLQDSKDLAEVLAWLKGFDTSTFEEFTHQANAELLASIRHVEAALDGARKREADAAELAELRAKLEERKQIEREEAIREEAAAAERNKIEEARKRTAAAEAAAQAAKEAAAKAEQERIEREAREQIAAAERRELEAKLAAQKEVQRIADEAKAKEDARIREQQEREEAERRAAESRARRSKVHKAIADAIADCTTDEIVAKLAAGSVPHVTVTYA